MNKLFKSANNSSNSIGPKINFLFYFSAPGGDFQSVLDEDMVPFEQDVIGFLRQILEALNFIHEKNIAHLDIKVWGRLGPFLTLNQVQ